LFDDVQPLQDGLDRYAAAYERHERETAARKLGLAECRDGDVELIGDLHALMHAAEIDMTLWFRALANVDAQAPSLAPMDDAFYDPAKRRESEAALMAWLARYAARLHDAPLATEARRIRMHAANPRYVPRNYLAQQVIDRAEQGDASGVAELLDVMRHPYDDQPGREAFSRRRPDWARNRPGSSTLSCSS